MIRWSSAVDGSAEMQEYYLRSANVRLNRHFFSVNARTHKKLLWLMATTVSPDLGTQKHRWIPMNKKGEDSKMIKSIKQWFPNTNALEQQVLAAVNSPQQLEDYIKAHGQSD
jgi:hypothetical protein